MQLKWSGAQTVLVSLGVAVMTISTYWLFVLNRAEPDTLKNVPSSADRGQNASSLKIVKMAKHQVLESVEMVYEAPVRPKGVLLLFHGCRHSSTDWWPKSVGCPACKGLPEEVRITQQALQAGYAAVALSSKMRQQPFCWDTSWPPLPDSDLPRVQKAVRALVRQQGWAKLPLYALGSSAGGALVLLLALKMPLQGVCCQIDSVPSSLLLLDPSNDKGPRWGYPPTVLINMARDKEMSQGMAENAKTLRQKGTAVLELEVQPQALTHDFLSNRTAEVSPKLSAAIHAKLLQAGMLDARGFLLEDPRESAFHWQALLEHVPVSQTMDLEHDASVILEELKVAYAAHELSSDNTARTLAFFESHTQ